MASVGFCVESSVGVNRIGHGGTGPGPAGLRSLPAKQHAPKARPLLRLTVAGEAGSEQAVVAPRPHHEPSGEPGGQ